MNTLSQILAHLFFLHLVLVEPVLSARSYRALTRRLALDPSARSNGYLTLLAWEWAWVFVVVVILISVPQPLDAIGLRRSRPSLFTAEMMFGAIGGALLSVVGATILAVRSPKRRTSLHRMLEPVSSLLPMTPSERWMYAAVALTAGICEELVYRGFLFFYLGRIGLPLVAVVLVSSLVFGLGHLYQGWRGVLQSGVGGVAFGIVYWLSGSLLPAIVLHALADMRVLLIWRPREETHVVKDAHPSP